MQRSALSTGLPKNRIGDQVKYGPEAENQLRLLRSNPTLSYLCERVLQALDTIEQRPGSREARQIR